MFLINKIVFSILFFTIITSCKAQDNFTQTFVETSLKSRKVEQLFLKLYDKSTTDVFDVKKLNNFYENNSSYEDAELILESFKTIHTKKLNFSNIPNVVMYQKSRLDFKTSYNKVAADLTPSERRRYLLKYIEVSNPIITDNNKFALIYVMNIGTTYFHLYKNVNNNWEFQKILFLSFLN